MKLYRGFDKAFPIGITKNIFKDTPRRPIDTDDFTHRVADEYFYDRFGIKGRSETVLCTPCKETALYYAEKNNGKLYNLTFESDPNTKFLFSSEVADFYDIRCEIDTLDESEILRWLDNAKYKVVDSIDMIDSDNCEVMAYCSSFEINAL